MSAGPHRPVLLVEDDVDLREAQVDTLRQAGFAVQAFAVPRPALAMVSDAFAGVIVTDLRLPGGMDGLGLFEAARRIDEDIPVLLLTAHGDIDMAVRTVKNGAYDFLAKPVSAERIIGAVTRAFEKRTLALERRALLRRLEDAQSPFLGESAAMERVRRSIRMLAEADVDVLILGETGVGKDLAARHIHGLSRRRSRPLVAVDCPALPEAIIETELFGYEPGAAPGLMRKGVGRIERADRGALYLDDVSGLAQPLQAKLLRLLEDRSIWPLGAAAPRELDLRVIASARPDLAELARTGAFRADLFHRLHVAQLTIPPLRERRGDAPGLFVHFLEGAAARLRRAPPPMTEAIRRRLLDYDWPGNVRELAHFAERVALDLEDAPPPAAGAPLTLAEKLDRYEAQLIREALAACEGDVSRSVDALGLPRKTLYDKLKRHGIEIRDYRS